MPAVELSDISRDEGVYEEALFGERLHSIVTKHDKATPLFLTYAARIAHYPIQVEQSACQLIQNTKAGTLILGARGGRRPRLHTSSGRTSPRSRPRTGWCTT